MIVVCLSAPASSGAPGHKLFEASLRHNASHVPARPSSTGVGGGGTFLLAATPRRVEQPMNSSRLPDEELVEQARTDAEAFGVLYDRYAEDIFRFVMCRLRDRAAAQDVTAEVFFKALRALPRYRPQGRPFRAWLYRITVNATTDHVRTRRVHLDIEDPTITLDAGVAVADDAVRRVEAIAVWQAIDALTPTQRTAVSLRLGQDLPSHQIAAVMGKSEGAVKLLIHRGIATVRERLERRSMAAEERR